MPDELLSQIGFAKACMERLRSFVEALRSCISKCISKRALWRLTGATYVIALNESPRYAKP
jgi:hypothetical protein